MQSHIRKVYVCLAVTCHLHFWQNDRGLLLATAVTRRWNGYWNKSQHKKLTLEKKILLPLQQEFEPATFRSRVRRCNHWAIPTPQTGTFESHSCFEPQFCHTGSTSTSSLRFVDTFNQSQTSIQHNYIHDFMNMKENILFLRNEWTKGEVDKTDRTHLGKCTLLYDETQGNNETQALLTENCLCQVQEDNQQCICQVW